MFIMIFCFLVKKFIINTIMGCFMMCKNLICQQEAGVEDKVADQEEAIGYYWDSLTGDDQKIWYASECYSNHMYEIRSVDDDTLVKLYTSDRRKAPALDTSVSKKGHKPKYIQGDSRYDILSNLKYQQQFQYISIEARNEVEDYLLSDMILVALNMDEYSKANDAGDIFNNSYKLLKSQALNTSATAKAKKDSKVDEDQEGGQHEEDVGGSDAYHRLKN